MARHNINFLYGTAKNKPIIRKTDTGDYIEGLLELNVPSPEGIQTLTIQTKEPELIKNIAEADKNSIILIKGTTTVKRAVKVCLCPNCGERIIYDNSVKVSVTPIFISTETTLFDENTCAEFLSSDGENKLLLFGTICSKPKKVNGISQFQVALNRKFLIRTDPPEIKADYPWVKSELNEDLNVGDPIYIEGYLRTRKVKRKVKCQACGNSFVWEQDSTTEIIPEQLVKLDAEKFA